MIPSSSWESVTPNQGRVIFQVKAQMGISDGFILAVVLFFPSLVYKEKFGRVKQMNWS
jgi:hypothetical protein